MYYAIDIILAAILVICVIRGYRKGFIQMLLETIGFVVSAVAAWFVSFKYSPVFYNSYLKEGIIRGINGRMTDSDTLDAATASFYSIPEQLRGIATRIGFDVDGISSTVSNKNLSTAQALEQSVVGPLVTVILKILMFIAVMIICSIIIRFVIGMVSRATKLPTIKKADSTFGAILGAVSGAVVVFLLAQVIFIVSSMIDNEIISDKVSSSFVISAVEKGFEYITNIL